MKALYTTTFNDRSKSFRWLIDYAAGLKRSIKGYRLTALTQRMMGCSNGMWTGALDTSSLDIPHLSEGEVCPKTIPQLINYNLMIEFQDKISCKIYDQKIKYT